MIILQFLHVGLCIIKKWQLNAIKMKKKVILRKFLKNRKNSVKIFKKRNPELIFFLFDSGCEVGGQEESQIPQSIAIGLVDRQSQFSVVHWQFVR